MAAIYAAADEQLKASQNAAEKKQIRVESKARAKKMLGKTPVWIGSKREFFSREKKSPQKKSGVSRPSLRWGLIDAF